MCEVDYRFQGVQVQTVWIVNLGRFEVSAGAIIRCQRGADHTAMHSTEWSKEEAELVSHVLRTVKPGGMEVECAWEGKAHKVGLTRPRVCWVIRRMDGTLYQIHPGHAEAFAREKYQELLEKER